MKLIKLKYKTMNNETKINSYLLNIPKKIVQQSGIDDTKKLKAEAKNKEIIIKESQV